MEQNKLENEFRNKLNQREINPSENSWDRLDAMLTVAEEKKSKRSYSWIYIAASIIGFAFFGTFFFNQSNKNTTVESNKVVMEKNQKVEPKKEVLSIIPLESKPESGIVILEDKKENKKSRNTNSIITNQIAQNSKPDSLKSNIKNGQSIPETEQFVSSNRNEKSLEEMLASVQTNSKAANSKTFVKVNPNTLLSQVDGELELSFREKVINKVNKNYQTVKVALANRNQE